MKVVRVLMAHNFYQQPGGEDSAFAAEKELLRTHGHEVSEYVDHNSEINSMSKFHAARDAVWSSRTHTALREVIEAQQPDIVHFHNTFARISPSAYYAGKELGVTVVQTLHNYRLRCPSAVYFRDGAACEDCRPWAFPWPGVLHACYRSSRAQSFAVASMLAYHRVRRTWHDQVDAYITASEFARSKLIGRGLPSERIFVKPNFSRQQSNAARPREDYVLLAGRLSEEKGVGIVLEAWRRLTDIPLKIAGDGPMRDHVQRTAHESPSIEYLGLLDREQVMTRMGECRFQVFASRMYEVFPMTIVEGFAAGIAVIAQRSGAAADIVRDGELGLLYREGDSSDLAEKVRWLWEHQEEAAHMGEQARLEHGVKYAPERNYDILMDIYSKAREHASA